MGRKYDQSKIAMVFQVCLCLCKLLIRLVRPEGFEPPTLWFEAKCSIQLSYGRGMT